MITPSVAEKALPEFQWLLSLTAVAFGLMGFFLPLSETGKQGAVLLICLVSCYWFAIEKQNIRFDFADWTLLFFLGSFLLSCFFAKDYYDFLGVQYDTNREIHAAYSALRIFFVFFAFRYIRVERAVIEKFFIILTFAYLLALLYGEFEVLNSAKTHIEIKCVGHVNHSSIFSVMLFFISLNLLCLYRSFKRIIVVACLLCSFIAVFQSGSRATLLALISALFVHAVVDHKRIKKKLLIAIFFFILSVVLYCFYCRTGFNIKLWFHDPSRIFIWKTTFQEWLKHNLFFGIGPNNSFYVNPTKYGKALAKTWVHLGHSHNSFLTLLLENGLFGFITYCVFIFTILFISLFSFVRNKSVFCLLGFDISVINIINSFGNTTFLSSSNELLMFIVWAIAMKFNKFYLHSLSSCENKIY